MSLKDANEQGICGHPGSQRQFVSQDFGCHCRHNAVLVQWRCGACGAKLAPEEHEDPLCPTCLKPMERRASQFGRSRKEGAVPDFTCARLNCLGFGCLVEILKRD